MRKRAALVWSVTVILSAMAYLPAEETAPGSGEDLTPSARPETPKTPEAAKPPAGEGDLTPSQRPPRAAEGAIEGQDGDEEDSLAKKVKKCLGLNGWYRARYYRDFAKDGRKDHTDEFRNDLRLTSEWNPVENLRLRISSDARVDWVRSEEDGLTIEEADLDLWEAFVKVKAGPMDLTVGREAIRWGKSDELNPTDNFTPEDFTEIVNYDRASRKIPAWMVHPKFQFLTDFTYEAVWQPFFEPNRGAPPDSDWFFPPLQDLRDLGLHLNPEEPPKRLPYNVFANRLLYAGSSTNFDAGITYAYHYNQTPALRIFPPNVEFRYHRQHTVGGEFEMTIGGFGVRGEVAHTTRTDFGTDKITDFDKSTQRDNTNFIFGMDYTFPNSVYINVQYAGRYIWHFSKDIAAERYEDQVLFTAYRWFRRDRLKVALSGRYAPYPFDYFINPTVEYKVNNYATAKLWVAVYGGEGPGLFNGFNQNDQVGFELKIDF